MQSATSFLFFTVNGTSLAVDSHKAYPLTDDIAASTVAIQGYLGMTRGGTPVFDLSFLMLGKVKPDPSRRILEYSIKGTKGNSVAFAVDQCDSNPTSVSRIVTWDASNEVPRRWIADRNWQRNREIVELDGYVLRALQMLANPIPHATLAAEDDIPL